MYLVSLRNGVSRWLLTWGLTPICNGETVGFSFFSAETASLRRNSISCVDITTITTSPLEKITGINGTRVVPPDVPRNFNFPHFSKSFPRFPDFSPAFFFILAAFVYDLHFHVYAVDEEMFTTCFKVQTVCKWKFCFNFRSRVLVSSGHRAHQEWKEWSRPVSGQVSSQNDSFFFLLVPRPETVKSAKNDIWWFVCELKM